jgi:hypothetical protein
MKVVIPGGSGQVGTIEAGNEGLVAQIFTSWNPLISWLRRVEGLKEVAYGRMRTVRSESWAVIRSAMPQAD